MRDKASALAFYAAQRDDDETRAAFEEIYLRACVRIGEISRELDAVPGRRTDKTSSGQSDKVSKTEALSNAGISRSTAHDYEQLAGGREEQAINAAGHAAEVYFSKTKADKGTPSMSRRYTSALLPASDSRGIR